MRGHFPSGPAPTKNIPSSSSSRVPITEAGKCRGTGEGVETWRHRAGSRLAVVGVAAAVVANSNSHRSFA